MKLSLVVVGGFDSLIELDLIELNGNLSCEQVARRGGLENPSLELRPFSSYLDFDDEGLRRLSLLLRATDGSSICEVEVGKIDGGGVLNGSRKRRDLESTFRRGLGVVALEEDGQFESMAAVRGGRRSGEMRKVSRFP